MRRAAASITRLTGEGIAFLGFFSFLGASSSSADALTTRASGRRTLKAGAAQAGAGSKEAWHGWQFLHRLGWQAAGWQHLGAGRGNEQAGWRASNSSTKSWSHTKAPILGNGTAFEIGDKVTGSAMGRPLAWQASSRSPDGEARRAHA